MKYLGVHRVQLFFVMKVCQLMRDWWEFVNIEIPDLGKREIAFESQKPGNFVRHLINFESEETLRDALINKCAISLYYGIVRQEGGRKIRDVVFDVDVKGNDWRTSIELALEEFKILGDVVNEELGLSCKDKFSGLKGFHKYCRVEEDSPWALLSRRGYEKLAAYLASLPSLKYYIRGRAVDICELHPLGSCRRAALQLQLRYIDVLVLTREEGLIRAPWSINSKSGLAAIPLESLDVDIEDLVNKATPMKKEYNVTLKEKAKIPWSRELGPGRVVVNFHELLYLLFQGSL